MRESVSERREAGGEVSKNASRLAPFWAIGDPAAGQFCKTREAVGYALDHAKRKRRRTKTCEKRGKNRGGSFVSPVREQTSEADTQHAAGEPAFLRRRRTHAGTFAHVCNSS